jgi:hypothetical protein
METSDRQSQGMALQIVPLDVIIMTQIESAYGGFNVEE